MEDHAAIPFPDIDSGDLNNPLAAVTYVEDIYTFYRKIEVKFLHDTKKKKMETYSTLIYSILSAIFGVRN